MIATIVAVVAFSQTMTLREIKVNVVVAAARYTDHLNRALTQILYIVTDGSRSGVSVVMDSTPVWLLRHDRTLKVGQLSVWSSGSRPYVRMRAANFEADSLSSFLFDVLTGYRFEHRGSWTEKWLKMEGRKSGTAHYNKGQCTWSYKWESKPGVDNPLGFTFMNVTLKSGKKSRRVSIEVQRTYQKLLSSVFLELLPGKRIR